MTGQLPPTRDVTQQDRDELLIPLASGVQELLFAPVNPFNNRPGFIAGPPPDTGLAQAVHGLTRLNCRLWATRDKSGFSPRVNQYNGEICNPYLDSLGEKPDNGSFLPPFTGGQCAGTNYRLNGKVTYTLQDCGFPAFPGQEQPTVTEFILAGPITSIQAVGLNPGNCGDTAFAVQVGTSSGVVQVGFFQSNGPNRAFLSPQWSGSLEAASGQPNNCGNPPVDVQPPATVTPVTPIVPTITVDLPGVGPTTINIDIDVDGNPVITAPDIDAEVTIAPTLDIDLGGGGGGGGDPGDPTDPGSPGNPEGTGPGGDAEGLAPEGSELVGLLVTVVESSSDANKFANNSKQPFRGIGYVRMGFPGRLGLDISGGTVISPQFFHAQQRGLTAWAVAANIGFNLSVLPFYRNIEP